MKWNEQTREELWSRVGDTPWDLIVVGGGITGAGILREAARLGARALLVEQRDFAWGTSSRSSKLVHGGLRYLAQLQLGVTRDSVRERERLLRENPGLVEPLGFVLAVYDGAGPGKAAYSAALAVYDALAGQWSHRGHNAAELTMLAPHLDRRGLAGGMTYGDAQTDDARLVLRVLREAATAGAAALNYVAADQLLHSDGRVAGVLLRDVATGRTTEVRAGLVINAAGAWADRLRGQLGRPALMRPLRGSHLVFPAWRLPVAQAISFPHPDNRRPVFVFPWEGVSVVGTTDVDHGEELAAEPCISSAEANYLMAAVTARFPALALTPADVISTWAGVRPVVHSGAADPSKESRDHVVRVEDGLLTVTGGKLTTFELLAREALHAARPLLPAMPDRPRPRQSAAAPPPLLAPSLDTARRRRLQGRYGADAAALVAAAHPGELQPITPTPTLWAELRWAARAEAVRHLDDLLLRRTRLGLLLPQGGAAILSAVRAICAEELGWDEERWTCEVERYCEVWRRCYGPPG